MQGTVVSIRMTFKELEGKMVEVILNKTEISI